MSKKRGLSLEEKRQRLLQIFFEKKEFFQLKELEKIAPKEKGITLQSVKEVLQSLVDDGLVDSERIGTSNYFWAFPSKAVNNRKRKITELEEKIDVLANKKIDIERLWTTVQEGREESTQRTQILQLLEERKKEQTRLLTELDQYKLCDPQVIKQLKLETTTAIDAANRWTENVFTVKSWCKEKFGVEESTMDSQFGIPDDLDFIS